MAIMDLYLLLEPEKAIWANYIATNLNLYSQTYMAI